MQKISAIVLFLFVGSESLQSNNIERRQALGLVPICVATALGTRSSRAPLVSSPQTPSLTIDEAVKWIDESCDRHLLSAVVASGYSFLYRGIPQYSKGIAVRTEAPDLLLPATYGDTDANNFFVKLEDTMKSFPVKPSTGHLATSSPKEASRWGNAASIWPIMGTEYAWFQDTCLFYPRSNDWDVDSIICNGRKCGKESLDDALLADNAEVLFTAKPFLAIPAELDQPLRLALQKSFLL